MKKYFRIGEIISLHGIKGEVKVYPMTDDMKRFDKLDSFYILDSIDADDADFVDGILYKKENVKYLRNTVVLKIKGFDTIDDARKLIKKNIYVSRENAIALAKSEYYTLDLIGCTAYHDNERLGEIVDVLKTKAHDILSVSCSGKEMLVPFVDEYIESVDVKEGVVKIRLVEGLV